MFHGKSNCLFITSVKKTFKSLSFCNISKFNNGFIWNPSQVQSFWTNCVFPLKSFFAKFTTFFSKLIWAMLVMFNSGEPGKLFFCYSIAYPLSCTELKIDWNYFSLDFRCSFFLSFFFVLCFLLFLFLFCIIFLHLAFYNSSHAFTVTGLLIESKHIIFGIIF